MEFKVLGPLEVRRGAAVLPLGGPGQRALLAILILCANEVVSTDRLFDLLWGDEPPDTARHILHINVSRLRKVLEVDPSNPVVLLTRAPGYLLQTPNETIDSLRFQALVETGRGWAHEDPARASASLSEALALWRGETLADLPLDPFTLPGVAGLEELRVSATEDRVEAELALGHHAEVVGDLRRLASEHPLRERTTQLLMLALYRSGRQSEALSAFEQARSHLASALGIDPGSALQELERAVLKHDPSLDFTPRRSPDRLRSEDDVPPADVSGEPNEEERPVNRRYRRSAQLIGLLSAIAVIAMIVSSRGPSSTEGRGQQALTAPEPLLIHLDDHGQRLGQTRGVRTVHGFRARVEVGEGAVWVSTLAGLSRIDPSNQAAEVSMPVRAGALAIGFHNVWDAHDLVLSEIDPATAEPLLSIGHAIEPAVAVGAGGVWTFEDGALLRLDPRTGRWNGRVPVDGIAADIAASGGEVWFVDFFGGSLTAVDARTLTVMGSVPIPGSPDIVDVGFDYVWVVERLSGIVTAVDPNTRRLVMQIPVAAPATGLAVGRDAVWVTAGNELFSINPATFKTTSVNLGVAALAVAVDRSDDTLWVYVDASPVTAS